MVSLRDEGHPEKRRRPEPEGANKFDLFQRGDPRLWRVAGEAWHLRKSLPICAFAFLSQQPAQRAEHERRPYGTLDELLVRPPHAEARG